MKNTKGSKLFVFLFDRAIVVTRSTHQQGRQMYQVYRQPIPVSELLVEDLPDGEVKLGSFRNAFGQGNQIGKHLNWINQIIILFFCPFQVNNVKENHFL